LIAGLQSSGLPDVSGPGSASGEVVADISAIWDFTVGHLSGHACCQTSVHVKVAPVDALET